MLECETGEILKLKPTAEPARSKQNKAIISMRIRVEHGVDVLGAWSLRSLEDGIPLLQFSHEERKKKKKAMLWILVYVDLWG